MCGSPSNVAGGPQLPPVSAPRPILPLPPPLPLDYAFGVGAIGWARADLGTTSASVVGGSRFRRRHIQLEIEPGHPKKYLAGLAPILRLALLPVDELGQRVQLDLMVEKH